MGNGQHYLTFTQGLILGQLSVFVLVALVFKFLFLDCTQDSSQKRRLENHLSLTNLKTISDDQTEKTPDELPESAEWVRILLKQIVDAYRSKLRDDRPGAEGDEIARQRIEHFANVIRPSGFLDYIQIHTINLGNSAPRLSNARLVRESTSEIPSKTEFDLHYTDTVSLSLSTSYLFNYPTPSFARLPVSLTISLSLFSSSVTVIPPYPSSPSPSLTIKISPDFTLDLMTTSLMGCRAKLANVPRLHELIVHQIRQTLAARAMWKIPLPQMGMANGAVS